LLAALSLAIDLGLGQPMEHMLRSSLIATRLADRLGLGEQQQGVVYYANLVAWMVVSQERCKRPTGAGSSW
jgi:hypothetical protein